MAEKPEKYATYGMRVQCSAGTMENYISTDVGHGVNYQGNPVLNANDHVKGVNLTHFGDCHAKGVYEEAKAEIDSVFGNVPGVGIGNPANVGGVLKGIITVKECLGLRKCDLDVPKPWINTNDDHILDGAPALTLDSICTCRYGGVISFVQEAVDAEAEIEATAVDVTGKMKAGIMKEMEEAEGVDEPEETGTTEVIPEASIVALDVPVVGAAGEGEEKEQLPIFKILESIQKAIEDVKKETIKRDRAERNEQKKEYQARKLLDAWWSGKMLCTTASQKDRITSALELMETLGEISNYTPYMSEEELRSIGYNESLITLFNVADMNRVFEKYDITTEKRMCSLLAESIIETRIAKGLPIESDNETKTYLIEKSYYPYVGVGNIQLTFEYGYQAFAVYMALKTYPDLQGKVKYANPKSNGPATINESYQDLMREAKRLRIDISDFTKICCMEENGKVIREGSKYIAEYFGWETAGYFWEVNGMNEIVDKAQNDEEMINNLTEIINYNMGDEEYRQRVEAYEQITSIRANSEKEAH